MIRRNEYMDRLIRFKDQQIIKVVTGVRRCGKSTLFELYREYLVQNGVSNDQIIFINLEDLVYEELLDYRKLYAYISERLNVDETTYIFIDEVQNCHAFEKAVDSLFINKKVDIYLTGSNAHMLSGELATLLSGRYITIDMLPLSFSEYNQIGRHTGLSIREKFNNYMRFGAFPYSAQLEQSLSMIEPYLEGIYSTILLKDVATRLGTSDISLLESIVKTLSSSIGSPISIKKITDTIQSSGRKVSINTIDSYVQALVDSYIFYKVDRYDIKGRQHLKTLGKYYIVDTGIRQMLSAQSTPDLGHLIENIVYLELRRRGYKVNVGKLDEKEIDFVASTSSEIIYVQVAASVLDETTRMREFVPLNKISDHYPKILLTLDEIGHGTSFNGIMQYNLLEWLVKFL